MADFFIAAACGHISTETNVHKANGGKQNIVSFSIAVNNNPEKDNEGNYIPSDPTYIEVTVFGKVADLIAANPPAIGTGISVTGKIIQKKWTQNGKTMRKHRLIASTLNFNKALTSSDSSSEEESEEPML